MVASSTLKTQEQYMQRAIELALMAEGRTSPNPLVGAVIVRDGAVVGEGYHHRAGEPHAEVNALRAAGELAKGATIYVTLEPCCHHGRTGPCCEALIAAGITEVIAATADPNPQVAGQGLAWLRSAGIKVETGLLEAAARDINQPFFKRIQTGLPYVILKTAMTLDGKIAAASGDARWVTGETSRRLVHQMRNRYDGVMVGANTVIKDDPQLNVRLEQVGTRNPVRVVVDGALDIPLTAQVVVTAKDQPTLILTAENPNQDKAERLTAQGVELIKLKGEADDLDLTQGLSQLANRGISSLLVEGGSGLNWSLIQAGLVDYWYAFIAMKVIGGANAPTPVGGSGFALMNDALAMSVKKSQLVGEDLLVEGWLGEPRRW
ncbi:MAG: bifunctional diaminohydroxyphosphoribosylaminopyrimidine deaminase/5-amino-6-(5-phosphoribosylamino)uracil reductase RibD [Methylocystaceae bacterium]